MIIHSICSGVTLGKYGDKHDDTSVDSAEGDVETTKRAVNEGGWARQGIADRQQPPPDRSEMKLPVDQGDKY